VVADLLERVLDRGERGAVRPFTLAVLLDAGFLSKPPFESATAKPSVR
jgi:hypothetical protein